MGLLFVERLQGEGVFRCRRCRVDAASKDAIISRDFYGRTGRAYLFDHVLSTFDPCLPAQTWLLKPFFCQYFSVNICLGPTEDRYLVTGLHTVNDIYCCCCQQILGWRYEKAYDQSQKYKEGKYILERARMVKDG
ncbi:putative yippee-like protein [Dichanthelium oligosanthes]|uniref:Protein yippee-like n=1 Tax=Dichanthelium oligosanthes TaxID=888268 RepID=A0A1E5V9B7_9POAL|nr:putative yippee-like protein [Dichanthelium oligosanthes]